MARESASTLPLRSATIDDALLYSLLSFAPLTGRGAILPFTSSLMAQVSGEKFIDLVIRMFQLAIGWTDTVPSAYQPVALPLVDRHAIYTLNLLLLAVAGGRVTSTQLFPAAQDPVNEWRRCNT